jgi:hypothetical protein
MAPDDLIPYADAARLLYPEQPPATGIARVRRLVAAGRLTRHRNPAPRGRGTWLVSRGEVERLATDGSAGQRPGGRPVKEPTAYDLRRLIDAIEHQLKQAPPRPLQVGYAVWDAAEAVGVKVFQPMGWDDWCWERGDRSGRAATAGEALAAALQGD